MQITWTFEEVISDNKPFSVWNKLQVICHSAPLSLYNATHYLKTEDVTW